MALAPTEAPGWLQQPPFFQDTNLSFDLMRLSSLIGVGLIRVDAAHRAWPLNEMGAKLLEALGGGYGSEAPEILSEILGSAVEAGMPQSLEAMTPSPDSRHVTIAVLGRASAGLVALRDQTDERMLQERLLQSEKMASVGQLVSGVAHELNNPLTGVMGFAQLLLSRDLDETAAQQVQTIYGEAERAAKIVQNCFVRPPSQAHEGDGGRQRPGAARPRAAQLRLHRTQHLARYDARHAHAQGLGRPRPGAAGALQRNQER